MFSPGAIVFLVNDDVVLGRLGHLDPDDGVGAGRQRGAGGDADGGADRHLDVEDVAGRLLADHLAPRRIVLGEDGVAVHRRRREGRVVFGRDQVLGQRPPGRLGQPDPLDRQRFGVGEDGRPRLVGVAEPIELALVDRRLRYCAHQGSYSCPSSRLPKAS